MRARGQERLAPAAIGVYGVMSCVVTQGPARDRHPPGARGAARQVQRRLVGQALGVVTVGAPAGLAAALMLTKLIESRLFHTRPNDPLTIAIVTSLLVAAAAIACWIPARRTRRVDPTESLRLR